MMKSRYEIKENICWIQYVEDKTFEKAYDFIKTMEPLLEEKTLKGVVLDLRTVDMLNSSGIGLILELFKNISEKKLIFVAITNDYVQRTLGMIGVEGLMNMVESRSKALELVRSEL
ncbi:MAG: STAS domain-containing protein [SAR324 cluster bacterium]|nr:STAS domain-containing protein [SAR324 cluster bacterium]